jgi:hypothetical protein
LGSGLENTLLGSKESAEMWRTKQSFLFVRVPKQTPPSFLPLANNAGELNAEVFRRVLPFVAFCRGAQDDAGTRQTSGIALEAGFGGIVLVAIVTSLAPVSF